MLAIAAFLAVAASLPALHGAAPPAKPRLVVLLVVDQMRADYLDRFRGEWTGGFHRLLRDGAWFRKAAYPYLSTVTCAGHATISTGATPHIHGVIANTWWDRARGATTTCTADPGVVNMGYGVVPTIGDSPSRLMVPSFADEMRRQESAHVVTLALKERSAIMLAGHGGDAVTWLSNNFDGWVTSPAFTKTLVPAVQTYARAHPIAADFGKTWDRLLPPHRYRTADDGVGETPPKGWTKVFPHVLAGNGQAPDLDFYHQWEASPFADAYVADMAAALAGELQLGKHDDTDLLAVSFSTPDIVGHAFGPDSQEVEDILAHLDKTLGSLFARLDALVGASHYVVALSADHGVTRIPEQLAMTAAGGGRVRSSDIISAIDGRLSEAWERGQYVAGWVGNDLYFKPGVYERLRGDAALMRGVVSTIEAAPGVHRVFRGDELKGAAASSDREERAAALSYFEGRSGDLIVALKPGWILSTLAATHGSAVPDDQRVPILFDGPWFRHGQYDDEATPADVAPTLARVCGITLPRAEGHPLASALASANVSRSTGHRPPD